MTARGGHVTPTVFDLVGAVLPDAAKGMMLEVVTVRVREGTNLIITLFENDVSSEAEELILWGIVNAGCSISNMSKKYSAQSKFQMCHLKK